MTDEPDEWPPKRARSLPDWAAYWERQRWDRRLRRKIRIRLAPLRRKLDHLKPRRIRGEILWRYQRVRRGWSYRDLWCMDEFLARVAGEMTARLLEVAHGYPCDGRDENGGPECMNLETGESRPCGCKAEYDEALRKISEGLLAYCAPERPGLIPAKEWMKLDEERIKAGREAFRLLADWLPTLWD